MAEPFIQRRESSVAAANLLTAAYDETIKHKVWFHDDTLRDGEQTVGVTFSVAQKIEIAKLVLDAGVQSMTVGFPVVAEDEREAVRAITKLGYDDRELWCLCRATKQDVDATLDCGVNRVALFIPTSDIHLKYKLQLDEDAAFDRITKIVAYAVSRGASVRAGFEDATRTPRDRLVRFMKGVVDAGAYATGIADTVGVLTPMSTYRMIRDLREQVGDELAFGVHFHNDLGMATANTVTAIVAGANIVMGSFAGLGERAGNVCIEEVATALRIKYGLELGIDLEKLTAAALRIAEIARMPIAPCKPILGANVFSHEAGIHVHGLTAEASTYEPFPPELLGRSHAIHYGKHSGLNSVKHLARVHGIEASDAALEAALLKIKQTAIATGAPTPAEAAEILRRCVAG
ncbi:MAG: homoaconitate hydratase [Kofleriaceae bacterium]